MRYHYRALPHPHLFIDEIAAPDVYRAMRFPDSLVAPGQSWGITSSDPQYAEVLADPHWRSLHDELCGEAMVVADRAYPVHRDPSTAGVRRRSPSR